MFWPLAKTAVFVVVVPGTVAILIPQRLWLQRSAAGMPPALRVVGIVLFVLGMAISLWCAWDFAVKGKGTPLPVDAPRVLVVQGLYRFTRNPMYVGVLAMIFAQAIYYGSRPVALYGCALFLGFHLFVRLYEEPTLRRLFGTQYEQYCHRVPRWFLRLG